MTGTRADVLLIPSPSSRRPTPTLELGTDANCDEEAICYFSGGAVSDADSVLLQLTLSVEYGVVSLLNVTGLSFAVGTGTRDTAMQCNGSVAAVNAALANVSHEPDADWNGHDSVVLSVTDLDTAPRSHKLDVAVHAVNDAPDVVAHIAAFAALDSVPVAIRGLSVADSDEDCTVLATNCNLMLTLRSSVGSLRPSQCLQLTGGAWVERVVLNGNVLRNNECAADVMFAIAAHWNSVLGHEIGVALDDNGYSGAGDAHYVTDVDWRQCVARARA